MAIEGYNALASELTAAQDSTGDFLEVGVAYVRFAHEHRAYFEVMFRPDLYHPEDPDLRAAKQRAAAVLYAGAGQIPSELRGADAQPAGVAAWSLVHGFASLWLTGSLPAELGDDPEAAARAVAGLLFRQH